MASSPNAERDRRAGVAYLLGSYTAWGAFPLYFRSLARLRPLEVMSHRMLWSALFLSALLSVSGRWRAVRRALTARVLVVFAASAAMLSCNWFVFVWAVDAGRVIDASLGYFINPLVSVLLGVALLGERLRAPQRLAVAVAVGGVAWLTFETGHVPWIGLALALSFGLYGFLRKTAPLGALDGLAIEALLMSPLALAILAVLSSTGQSRFGAAGWQVQLLMAFSGPLTAVPLLLFAAGTRRVPLSLTGILQYVTPTLHLAVGVLAFHEPFGSARLLGFALIWLALAIYGGDALRAVPASWSRRRA